MALNLWKMGGQPTNYYPLPVGWNNYVTLSGIGTYVIRIVARSVSGAVLQTWQADNTTQSYTLTANNQSIELTQTSKNSNARWYVYDRDSKGDIVIDSIELLAKPLPKLTINGVDGFNSGNWILHPNATVVDDETLVLNATVSQQTSYLKVPVVKNQNYVISRSLGSFDLAGFRLYVNNVTVPYNNVLVALNESANFATFNSGDNDFVYIHCTNSTTIGQFTFKRPMLNLGTAPAPYSKKTGDKMVLPSVKGKNLFDGQLVVGSNNPIVGSPLQPTVNGARCRSINLSPVLSNTIYTVNTNDTNKKVVVQQLDGNKNLISDSGWKGNLYTFTTNSNCMYLSFNLANNTDTGVFPSDFPYLQLEQNSTATPYESYAVQVNKKPKKLVPTKNLVPSNITYVKDKYLSNTSGTEQSSSGARCAFDFVAVNPNTTYTLSYQVSGIYNLVEYNANKTFVKGTGYSSVPAPNVLTFTTSSSTYYVRFDTDVNANNIVDTIKPQLELGSVATDYTAYELDIPKVGKGLSFDGMTSYLQLPFMKMDSIEIDCLIDSIQPQTDPYLIDPRNGLSGGHITWSGSGGGFSTVYVNSSVYYATFGVNVNVPKNERVTIKMIANAPFSDDVTIFAISNPVGTRNLKGTIYKVTCYLAGEIVSQYNFEDSNAIVGTGAINVADYVGTRKNLVPPLTKTSWQNFDATTTIVSDTKLTINSDGVYRGSRIPINVIPGRTYTVSGLFDATVSRIRIGKGTDNTVIAASDGSQTFSFTVPTTETSIGFTFDNVLPTSGYSSGLLTFENIQLEEGTTVTAYEPYQVVTIPRNIDNLIPSFDDSRWTINTNSKVLGKDILHLDAPGAFQTSNVTVDVKPNTSYYVTCRKNSDRFQLVYLDDKGTNLGQYLETTLRGNVSTIVTTPAGCTKIDVRLYNNLSGSYDFIRPTLVLLDGKEGIIYGSPIRQLDTPKRILYAKR